MVGIGCHQAQVMTKRRRCDPKIIVADVLHDGPQLT